MRCLTLADQLKNHGATTLFVCRDLMGNLGELISAKGHEVKLLSKPSGNGFDLEWCDHAQWLEVGWEQDALETEEVLSDRDKFDCLVVDHYALERRWEARLKSRFKKILVIDDLADRPHDCDLLLDQNLYKGLHRRYQDLVPVNCRQLLGPRYALLRQEFLETRQRASEDTSHGIRLLVFLGGVDREGVTLQVLAELPQLKQSFPDLLVDVVVGGQNPHREILSKLISEMSWVELHCQIDYMADLMSMADMTIGAGGATTWERCCLGVPALVLSVAVNQVEMTRYCAEEGLLHYLGPAHEVDAELLGAALRTFLASPEARRSMASKGLDLVDGLGARRVAAQLIAEPVLLREVVAEDSDVVYRWRNAESTRRYIFNSEPINRVTHERWFAGALNESSRILLMGVQQGVDIGLFRFDVSGSLAKVSVFLDPSRTGHGVGLHLVEAGCAWARKNLQSVDTLTAEIMPENEASLLIFAKAGFREHHRIFHFSLRR